MIVCMDGYIHGGDGNGGGNGGNGWWYLVIESFSIIMACGKCAICKLNAKLK